MSTMQTLTVSSFGFAPVKGIRHLPQQHAILTPDGAAGDRRFCVVDVDARRVLRTVQHPQLMAVQAHFTPEKEDLRLTFPGEQSRAHHLARGGSITCDYWGRSVKLYLLETTANRAFSDYLGKPVNLAESCPRGIMYGKAFSLIGTATLEELGRALEHPLLEEHARFRSTFLIKTERPFQEDEWVGQEFSLVPETPQVPEHLADVVVRAGEGIGRCAVIDANPLTGVRDLKILKHLAGFRPRNTANEPLLGAYAELICTSRRP